MKPSTCLTIARTRLSSMPGSSSVSARNRTWSFSRARAFVPLRTAEKNGLAMSGTTTPMLPVRPVVSARAARFGE